MLTRRIKVSGLVQGVGYRFFVVRIARSLGVTGWVRNLPDGDVEVVAQTTEPAKLEELVSQLQIGPPGASVKGVVVEQMTTDEEFSDFRIKF